MIVNPAIRSPAAVSHPFTLNELRAHNPIAEEPSSTSTLTFSGLVLAVFLAIGAFIRGANSSSVTMTDYWVTLVAHRST